MRPAKPPNPPVYTSMIQYMVPHTRWCSRSLPRHSSIVGDEKSSVFSLSETWKLCLNVSSKWNLPASNSFSLLTREIFNIRTIHLLQNCWFILPCQKKKSWINWCQNGKETLNGGVWLWYLYQMLLMWQRWTYVSWGAWWKILTEVLYPPNPGQIQTPLQKI